MAGEDLLNPAATGTQELDRDRRVFGGEPRKIVGTDQNGRYIWGPGSVERETQRYQSLGEAAANRAAYQNDWAQANASRGSQGQALGLMQSAAYGMQPSAAQIQGRNMLDQSLQAQMAAAASARGGSLAQAAAMRNAATMGDVARQQGMNNLAALRAQEMAQARGDYFGASSGMRGQDIQQQYINQQSELAQRQLNQQAQQWAEGRRYDVLAGEQQAGLQQQAIETGQAQFAANMDARERDRRDDMIGASIGAGSTMFTGAMMASDVRAKNFIGSEAAPVGGAPSLGQAAAIAGTPYVGIDITRDDPYAVDPTSAGMMMRKPSGFGHGMSVAGAAGDLGASFGRMISDPRAKKAAFIEGMQYMQESSKGEPGKTYQVPDYVREQPPTQSQPKPPPVTAQMPTQAPSLAQAIAHPAVQNTARVLLPAMGGPLASVPVVAHDVAARADGGPVAPGRPYLVGERGPELVVPQAAGTVIPAEQTPRVIELADDVTMTDPREEAAFQAWKKRYAHPLDNGEDYDLRGAWKAGLKPGPDGHWPDTFKRPNHPTFSDESKYAGNEGARPGHWNGDEFSPYVEPGSDRSTMRDGASDERTRNFDRTVVTGAAGRAQMKRDLRAYQDKAGRDADAMMAGYKASLGQGPATSVALARAARSMQPAAYTYKAPFVEPGQDPNEVHVGPRSAQQMEKDPIAATAVDVEPNGLRVLNGEKLLKLNSALIANQQHQIDSLGAAIAKRGRT